jgi:hypothetical protein
MGGMPWLIEPMMASLRRGLPHDDDWYGWEFKWDGVCASRMRLMHGRRVVLPGGPVPGGPVGRWAGGPASWCGSMGQPRQPAGMIAWPLDRDLVFPYQVSNSTWISRGEMLAILRWRKNAGRRTSVEARMSSFSSAGR